MSNQELVALHARIDSLRDLEQGYNEELSSIYSSSSASGILIQSRADRISDDLVRVKVEIEEVLAKIEEVQEKHQDDLKDIV